MSTEIYERNLKQAGIEIVEYSKQYNCSIEQSIEDWLGEGPTLFSRSELEKSAQNAS